MISLRSSRVLPGLARAADAFLLVEPLWTFSAAIFVYLACLFGARPLFLWLGIALASLPFPVRLLRGEGLAQRTPFDIPIVLLTAGAVVGWYVSPDRAISLGALQCLLAATLVYYSWLNYRRPDLIIRVLIASITIIFLGVLVLFVLDLPGTSSQPNLVIGGSGTHHGLAMYLAIIAAVLLGIGLFAKSWRTRVLTAVVMLSLLAVVVWMTAESMDRLVDLVSIRGRWPVWERTAGLLRDSPIRGLGLGCWAIAYYQTSEIGIPTLYGRTHPHNAYLELYANTGLLGVLALALVLVIGAKLSFDILRAPRRHPWYGFGIGVMLASVITLLVGVVESAPAGVPMPAGETYIYVVSPILWVLCGLLTAAHRLVTGEAADPGGRTG